MRMIECLLHLGGIMGIMDMIGEAIARAGVPDLAQMRFESEKAWESFAARRDGDNSPAFCLTDHRELAQLRDHRGQAAFRHAIEILLIDFKTAHQSAVELPAAQRITEELKELLGKVEAKFYYWTRCELKEAGVLLSNALVLHWVAFPPSEHPIRRLLPRTRLRAKEAGYLRTVAENFKAAGAAAD